VQQECNNSVTRVYLLGNGGKSISGKRISSRAYLQTLSIQLARAIDMYTKLRHRAPASWVKAFTIKIEESRVVACNAQVVLIEISECTRRIPCAYVSECL
jgi:hypothetical protein